MEINTSTIQLDSPDGKMDAYVGCPKEGGPYPGIVVLMEAFGVNSHIKDVTDRIAREGYVAITPDLFYREPERITVPYEEIQKAVGFMNRLQDLKVMEDVGVAISYLKSQSSPTIGVTGFCMGGRFTYLAAAHHNKDLKAAVSFYGGSIPSGSPSPLERSGEIACPIQLFFGEKDHLIPADVRAKIKKALTDGGKQFSMDVYPEAGHSFFCDDRNSYQANATKDAWEKTKAFFAKHLK